MTRGRAVSVVHEDFRAWKGYPWDVLNVLKTKKVWELFCQFRDLRWHSYEPLPESPDLEVLIAEVRKDPTGIFWG